MKRQNFSRKREAILEAICSTDTHPTAEWVYHKLKPDFPDLSLGTVYRNIAKFKEDGMVSSVGVVNGQERLDGNTNPHAHFICNSCGAVLDLKREFLTEGIDSEVEKLFGLEIMYHELVFRGKCKNCLVRH